MSQGFVSRVLAEQPKGEGVMPGAAGSACQQELQASSQEHHASSQEHEASMRDGGGQGGAGAEAGVAVLEWKSRGQTVLKGFAQSQETFDLQTEAGDRSKGGQDESTGAARPWAGGTRATPSGPRSRARTSASTSPSRA